MVPRIVVVSVLLLACFACSGVLGLDKYENEGVAASSTGGRGGAGGFGAQGGMAGAGGGDESWFGRHTRRMRLLLDTTVVRADMQDFPAPIVIATEEDLASEAQPDGRDIVFTAADGITKLSHEIELYDGMIGALVAWVRLPTIKAADTTSVYLYYGDPDADDQQDRAGTWPAPRYRGVWHLSDNPAGAPLQMSDSSTFGSDGETIGVPASVDGAAAAALEFDAGPSRVSIADADQLDFDPAGFSFSCWVKPGDSIVSGGKALQKIGGGTPSRGYLLRLGDGLWYGQLFDGVATLNLWLGNEMNHIEAWTQLAVVADPDGGFFVAYVNGKVKDSQPIDTFDLTNATNSEPLYLSAGGGPFLGAIDEVRLYGAALTEDWVALEHHALTSPTYLSMDDVEVRP